MESCTALVEELDGRLHIVEWVHADGEGLALKDPAPTQGEAVSA